MLTWKCICDILLDELKDVDITFFGRVYNADNPHNVPMGIFCGETKTTSLKGIKHSVMTSYEFYYGDIKDFTIRVLKNRLNETNINIYTLNEGIEMFHYVRRFRDSYNMD